MTDRIEVTSEEAGEFSPEQEQAINAESESTDSGFEVPDKFIREDGEIDVAALARSYMELERSKSASPPPQAQSETNGVLQDSDYESILRTISTDGDLSDEQYAEYERRGLSRAFMNSFVQGQQAQMNQQRAEVFSTIGGEQVYAEMTEWAASNLSQGEIDAYDKIMMSGNTDQIKLQMQGLYARYSQATNRPRMLNGQVGQNNAAGAFQSWNQVTTAMKDPRYQNDPAYRKSVEQRLAVTKNL